MIEWSAAVFVAARPRSRHYWVSDDADAVADETGATGHAFARRSRAKMTDATTQLTTQASQIRAKTLVGQVTIQPLRKASVILPGLLGMFEDFANGSARQVSDHLPQERLDQTGLVTKFTPRLLD